MALTSFYEVSDTPGDVETMDTGVDEDNSSEGAASGSQGGTTKVTKDNKSKEKKSASGARIVTLNNMSKSSDEEEEGGQAFYAGGSDRSGQQVLGPPRKNPLKDYVSEVFRSAKESGAEVVENPDAASSSTSRRFVNSLELLAIQSSSLSFGTFQPVLLRKRIPFRSNKR